MLGRDVGRARRLLRGLIGEIVLRPTSEGLVAELRGNVEGLLVLEGILPAGLTGNRGSGGPICSNRTPQAYRSYGRLGTPNIKSSWLKRSRQVLSRECLGTPTVDLTGKRKTEPGPGGGALEPTR